MQSEDFFLFFPLFLPLWFPSECEKKANLRKEIFACLSLFAHWMKISSCYEDFKSQNYILFILKLKWFYGNGRCLIKSDKFWKEQSSVAFRVSENVNVSSFWSCTHPKIRKQWRTIKRQLKKEEQTHFSRYSKILFLSLFLFAHFDVLLCSII